eukprot:gene1472-4216_t
MATDGTGKEMSNGKRRQRQFNERMDIERFYLDKMPKMMSEGVKLRDYLAAKNIAMQSLLRQHKEENTMAVDASTLRAAGAHHQNCQHGSSMHLSRLHNMLKVNPYTLPVHNKQTNDCMQQVIPWAYSKSKIKVHVRKM